MTSESQQGVMIDHIGGNCPVQAEGAFDGVPFYFRARGTQVTCDVGADGMEWTWHGPEYEWPDAGWISEDTALAFIGEAYKAWLRRDKDGGRLARARRHNDFRQAGLEPYVWAGRLREAIGSAAQPAIEWLEQYGKELNDKANREIP